MFGNRRYDEVEAVQRALRRGVGRDGIMLDVGGHHGESFEGFAEDGWQVYCFEPNPANHRAIHKRIAETKGNVTLLPYAVSDTPQQGLTFYVSDESTGISSLHPFHDTHREGFKVDAITLRDHIRDTGIQHVDFLKIDTEGFDLFVLKGIDWDVLQPQIIVCEFEDRKTLNLGYSYTDMAQYLVDQGYEVIVSEWHPIVAYGQSHTWNRYTRFPSKVATDDAWGNLVAMRAGPHADKVMAALRKIGPIG